MERDKALANGMPAAWLLDEEEVARRDAEAAAMQQAAQQAQIANDAAGAVQKAGGAEGIKQLMAA